MLSLLGEVRVAARGGWRVATSGLACACLLAVGTPSSHARAAGPESAGAVRGTRTGARDMPRVGVVEGALSGEHPSVAYPLLPLAAGETLDLRLEAGSPGSFLLTVAEPNGQTLASASPSPDGQALVLAWRTERANSTAGLIVAVAPGARPPGPFRLAAGLDVPEVLRGGPLPRGKPVIVTTDVVRIGIKLQQIVNIDQKAENFDAVATLRMEWRDPALAFDPLECRCRFRVLTLDEFQAYVARRDHRWPAFTMLNQQGNRWSQGRYVALWPDGRALYYEQLSTTFQAPYFNFRRFPFDRQVFTIEIEPILPVQFYRLADLPAFTAVGHKLGEEEWAVVGFRTHVSDVSSGGFTRSHFTFEYRAKRHLASYWFRILVPLLLIITVTWLTFFLKDFARRIEATSANLLLFVAYYLAVGSDLPRLGYVTLLDALFLITFVLGVSAVAYNVQLRRLEARGERALAEKLDRPMLLAYPMVYLAVWIGTAWMFLG